MLLIRLVRWPVAVLLLVGVASLVAAVVGDPWQWSPATVSLGSVGELPLGFHLGVIQAVLLCLVAGVGTVATFYSARNLVGQHRQGRYALLELALIVALAAMVTTISLPLLAVAWTIASLSIAGLVAHAGTSQAQQAARQVRGRLLAGDVLLWACVVVLGLWLGTWSLDELPEAVDAASSGAITVAALLLVGAGVVRSALVPAHRWLPETAEAPSPVSALLHAGLVNGVGVLALLMWPLVAAAGSARVLLVVLGAATALVATAQMRTRADLKGRLAASTSSQMGYLAVQVGLGIPAAVLAHVVGHGVWKAGQFLGAGDAVARVRRADRVAAKRTTVAVVVGCGALAAVVVVGAAVVPAAGWPALLAPAELLPLGVAFGVAWLALAAVLRSPVGGWARTLAAAVILVGAAAYVLALRALVHLLVPAVGEPAAWSTPEGLAAAAAVVALVMVGLVATLVDRRARAGRAPALARSAARASLRPWTVRERLAHTPDVALALPPVTDADAELARQDIAVASASIGALYPLTSFVASNPLAGLEDLDFADAGHVATELWGARPGPEAGTLRRALAEGRVSGDDVEAVVSATLAVAPAESADVAGLVLDVPALARLLLVTDDVTADRMTVAASALTRAGVMTGREVRTPMEAAGLASHVDARVNDVAHHCCARSLAGTTWPGAAGPWSELQAAAGELDALLGVRGAGDIVAALPADAAEATAALLEHLALDPRDRPALIGRVLARHPGWAAHLTWRDRHARLGREAGLPTESGIDPGNLLHELVATRLAVEVIVAEAHAPSALGRAIRAEDLVRPVAPDDLARLMAATEQSGFDLDSLTDDDIRTMAVLLAPLADGGLARMRAQVLERAYRAPLLAVVGSRAVAMAESAPSTTRLEPATPVAQVITCIDVRSERMRRHLEQVGPWETFGAAGFFGIPLRYSSAEGTTSERSPALLRPTVQVTEHAASAHGLQGTLDALTRSVRSVEAAPGLVFGWAEAIGWLLAPVALARTMVPAAARRAGKSLQAPLAMPTQGRLDIGADTQSLADAAAAFLSTTGLRDFASVVVLCGHGATVTNNPHVAAYDCGACGGAAGDVSARTMSAVLNDAAVRTVLRDAGIDIPDRTRFVAAQHDTTTDAVRLLDVESVSADHAATLDRLLADAGIAGGEVRAERMPLLPDTARPGRAGGLAHVADNRAADWAQPRPEWGLAGAAAIVVGPRSLTEGLDLDGRVFLQSYRPDLDLDGSALEQLLAAPVVVAQWITSQYWASLIDPVRFGAGDKTTHNVVGDGASTSAVVTGARGDLRIGLPWQAVSPVAPSPAAGTGEDPWSETTRHQPQRLLAVVYADTATIDAVLQRQPSVRRLVTGEWLVLCAVDPHSGTVRRCLGDGHWVTEHPLRQTREATRTGMTRPALSAYSA